jgi:hypothetical protein
VLPNELTAAVRNVLDGMVVGEGFPSRT